MHDGFVDGGFAENWALSSNLAVFPVENLHGHLALALEGNASGAGRHGKWQGVFLGEMDCVHGLQWDFQAVLVQRTLEDHVAFGDAKQFAGDVVFVIEEHEIFLAVAGSGAVLAGKCAIPFADTNVVHAHLVGGIGCEKNAAAFASEILVEGVLPLRAVRAVGVEGEKFFLFVDLQGDFYAALLAGG